MKYVGNIVSVKLNKEAEVMPQCIKPTGNFGIGMQSVFQVVDTFDVQTRTRNGSGKGDSLLRKMKFYSNRIDGSIISYDLSTDSEENRRFGYGTKTIIRIPFSDLSECIKPLYKIFDQNIDCLADPLEIYKEVIKNYTKKLYSNSLIPLYVNGEVVINNTFGNDVINVQTLAGENDNNRYIVYDKDCSDTFSFYDENAGVLILYRWTQETDYKKNGNVDIYYKGILVNDFQLKNDIKIPFFDVQIYMYMGTPENYLEINRDSFLMEKHDNLASRVRLTHMNAMKALFASDNETSLIWKSQDNDQLEYRQAVKKYMSVIVRNYSKDIDYSDTNFLSQSDFYPNKYNCHSYYLRQKNHLRFLNNKQSGEISPMDKMLENGQNIWFVDADKLYQKDAYLKASTQFDDWNLLCHDRFVSYPEIAIRKAKTLITSDDDALLIYKTGKRTGGTVEISESDYWEYVVYKYRTVDKISENIRLVLPGTGRYEAAEVYSLPSGIKSREAFRFNRYFIAPMSIRELRKFLNQKLESLDDVVNYLKKFVKDKEKDEIKKEDYWLENQSLLVEHVKKYSAKQIHSNPFRDVSLSDICRCYVTWLWDFYNKYHSM